MNTAAVQFDPTTVWEPPAAPRLTAREARTTVAALSTAQVSDFEAIARAHHGALVRFATQLCGDASEARDLVQDTFERALRRFDSFEPGTNARAWLFRILHNAFIDRCRKRTATPKTEWVESIAAPETDAPPAWASITREQLRAAIDQLDPSFRLVYVRHEIDGRSYQEISAELAIPMNTVGTRLARARRKLKAILVELTSKEGGDP
jgi:RNA polymerase sigma-70 factor (ECF subfamily)